MKTGTFELYAPDGAALEVGCGFNQSPEKIGKDAVLVIVNSAAILDGAPQFLEHLASGQADWVWAVLRHPGKETEEARLSPECSGTEFAEFLAGPVIEALVEKTGFLPTRRILCGCGLGALHAVHTARTLPGVFTRFGCLSTSFEDLSQSLPHRAGGLLALDEAPGPPVADRMFFDHGDTGLDECYEPYHRELESILRAKGWMPGREFLVRKFPGGTHTPGSWRQRLPGALDFLLEG